MKLVFFKLVRRFIATYLSGVSFKKKIHVFKRVPKYANVNESYNLKSKCPLLLIIHKSILCELSKKYLLPKNKMRTTSTNRVHALTEITHSQLESQMKIFCTT